MVQGSGFTTGPLCMLGALVMWKAAESILLEVLAWPLMEAVHQWLPVA